MSGEAPSPDRGAVGGPGGERRPAHPPDQLSAAAETGQFRKDPACELCRAARITPWHHEDEICWIAECDICEVPMVVWRWHGTEPPAEHLAHMRARLAEVATARIGEFYVDDHMRNIPDHYHAHGRPKGGFFGHDVRRPGG